MSIYVIAYAMEVISSNLENIKFFIILEYFGFALLPALWLMLSYKFYFNKGMPIRISILISIIPFATVFINATNDYHHLYYASISTIEINGYVLANITKGIWYYIFTIYSYIVLIIGSYIFYVSWKQTKYNMKTQCFWMFFGSIWPTLASVLYLLNIGPIGLDLIPFSFLILGLSYFIALFKYDFLELKEIVRGYAFGQINEGILVLDGENRIIDFNSAGQRTFEWLNHHNIGKSIMAFDEGKKIMENVSDFFEVDINQRGELKYYEFRVTSLRENNEIVGRVFLYQDITEQKLAIDRLNYIATHDTLSEIFNRNKLMEEIEKVLYFVKRHCGEVSILMLDIDYFKHVNDKYGHIVGDMVIKNVAQGCKSKLRTNDVIGRYGGEEFLIILPGTIKDDALIIADDIRNHIAGMKMNFGGQQISITISIGVVTVSDSNNHITPQELINHVDMALYIAKNSGRNTVSTL